MFSIPSWDGEATEDVVRLTKDPMATPPVTAKKKRKKPKKKKSDSVFIEPQKDQDSPEKSQAFAYKEAKQSLKKSKSLSSLKSLVKTSTSSLESVAESATHLLKRGIKFASLDDFANYMGGSKRKRSTDEDLPESSPKSKKAKTLDPAPFDREKLKVILDGESATKKENASGLSGAKSKLKSSRFRYLNELLYTQTGSKSFKMFKEDPHAFRDYHDGYMEQARKWPVDPLKIIITAILKMSGNPVIADFGCGEARLAKALSTFVVHSFDLVATDPCVTACDMAHTPLGSNSVDIAVFCLSLMGTNLKDYLKEANRVLKTEATLKIAEVESRFTDTPVDKFVHLVEKAGFSLKWKDTSQKYFVLMDFKKVDSGKKKMPELSLKPCFYKKR
ncbi:hypothetical protein TCAL_09113 [Tigriopus californicus]|uniref:Ribosomal RNA-processing protein 8 n=1 Tax=Tigriopus californicus TaxID=6832 RepID=A0A553P5N9_TIGCA|nr:uncharacterized protein LOC131878502 [Tigriopus californicus]TRY73005.1 hypothetical protein TCAL_09113 [Tigriopus californicus]|eukprot:TCALIF_09113-PA protein Name:"Similar to Rrp8 Ribosomal RNA-processing protein 8 (Mus musculus)" AED:0.26 eAED:0.26 QI:126/1/1/1/0.66/0.75/4/232/388